MDELKKIRDLIAAVQAGKRKTAVLLGLSLLTDAANLLPDDAAAPFPSPMLTSVHLAGASTLAEDCEKLSAAVDDHEKRVGAGTVDKAHPFLEKLLPLILSIIGKLILA